MNQKIIMLMAAFSIFAIVGTNVSLGKVQAYTADELSASAATAYHMTKNLGISTFAVQTCTNQIESGDMSNVDACISIINTFDKHVSQAVSEANSDIAKVTGYGSVS